MLQLWAGILMFLAPYCHGQCTFPADFQATWVTSNRGTWTVSANAIAGFEATTSTSGTITTFNMKCFFEYNGFYVLKSTETFELFTGNTPHITTCMFLNMETSSKYTYALLTAPFQLSGTTERINIVYDGQADPSGDSICNDLNHTLSGERIHVALKSGSELSGIQDCPVSLQGTFTYSGTACASTYVDVCTTKSKIDFNQTICSENMFYSTNGDLYCVYDKTFGSNTYTTIYNSDGSVDGSNTFKYTCLVVYKAGTFVYISSRPKECTSTQVPTSAPSGGKVSTFEDLGTSSCTQTTTTTTTAAPETSSTWIYIVIAIIAVILLLIAIIIICCCLRKCRKSKKIDDEEKGAEEEKKEKDDDEKDEDQPEDDNDKKDQTDETPEVVPNEEIVPQEEDVKKEEEAEKTSIDSGFIAEKEEEKIVKEDGGDEKDNDDRPETNMSKMSDLGESVAPPSSRVEGTIEENESENDDDSGKKENNNENILSHTVEFTSDKIEEENDTGTPPLHTDIGDELCSHEGQHDGGHDMLPDNEARSRTNTVTDQNVPRKPDAHYSNDKSMEVEQREEKEEEMTENQKDTNEEEKDEESEDEEEQKRESGDSDMSENERQLRLIGDKKKKQYEPQGELGGALITREMEETERQRKDRRRKRRRRKRHRDNMDDGYDEGDFGPGGGRDQKSRRPGQTAEFLEQYQTKKRIERKLDDDHYWSEDEEKEDYGKIFNEIDKKIEILEEEEQARQREEQEKEKNSTEQEDNTGTLLHVADNTKLNNNNTKDSDFLQGTGKMDVSSEDEFGQQYDINFGNQSDLNSDSDDFSLDEDGDLPPGYFRDSEGRIIRKADGKVVSKNSNERRLKRSRLGQLFRIPRLKRNKKGRPTGGYQHDDFGPERVASTDNKNRSPSTAAASSPFNDNDRKKTVVFDVDTADEVGLNSAGDDDKPKARPDTSSATYRERLRRRLFKSKKKKNVEENGVDEPSLLRGTQIMVAPADNANTRELNSLRKVFPLNGLPPRSTQLGTSTSGQKKITDNYDPARMKHIREGLRKDQQILENLTKTEKEEPWKRHNIKEAFIEGTEGDQNKNSYDGIRSFDDFDDDDEDEFFVVGQRSHGDYEYQTEDPLFTRVRYTDGPLSRIPQAMRNKHEFRHTIPWSIIQPTPVRQINSAKELPTVSKSVDLSLSSMDNNSKKEMDERRLKILLEELYKDKKYFDHVINTTDAGNQPEIDERFLAEHGRNFLLDRADYWEEQPPLPRHFPESDLARRISRMPTNMTVSESGHISVLSRSTTSPPIVDDSIFVSDGPSQTPPLLSDPNLVPIRQEHTFS